ncbi:MAG TPA: methyltransferase domain-containing protein [Bryobacteraceae bacterium]|nr:methyltransferase domain-containing protein [Bryobacteraceae bacterium]
MAWDTELYEARHGFVWTYGEDLVSILKPLAGERILDLGCGPGQLTDQIAKSGAEVVGLDASLDMIGQARQNFPKLKFVLQDAAAMKFEDEFDAVFSNAALHWMLDAEGVLRAVAKALRKGGRFVAEMGGKGNIQTIEEAIRRIVAPYYSGEIPARRTYFPAIGEYASLMEACGLETQMAQLFDRPTPLEGEQGMANWIRGFKWYYFESLPNAPREQALREVVEELQPALCTQQGWHADYRRLRVTSIKPE